MTEIKIICFRNGIFIPEKIDGDHIQSLELITKLYCLRKPRVDIYGILYDITTAERNKFKEWCEKEEIVPIFSLKRYNKKNRALIDSYNEKVENATIQRLQCIYELSRRRFNEDVEKRLQEM